MTKAPSLTPDELIRLLKKHGLHAEEYRTPGSATGTEGQVKAA